MFEDFSFTSPSRQRAYYKMENSVSPSSSRESSPECGNNYNSSRRYPLSNPIAELSRHFNQHSLTPRRLSTALEIEESSRKDRGPNQFLQSPNSFPTQVARRRQSTSHLQCSSSHLSRISSLVEDMVRTGQPLYDPTHPSTILDDSTSDSLSPDEQSHESSDSYFGFTPVTSSYSSTMMYQNSAQRTLRHSHSYKIDKDVRHSALREGLGKPMVLKKIRMRKSSKSLSKRLGKRCE